MREGQFVEVTPEGIIGDVGDVHGPLFGRSRASGTHAMLAEFAHTITRLFWDVDLPGDTTGSR